MKEMVPKLSMLELALDAINSRVEIYIKEICEK